MSCGVGHRCGSDRSLLRLCCRLVAVALMQSLAWEPPYAALKRAVGGGGAKRVIGRLGFNPWPRDLVAIKNIEEFLSHLEVRKTF